MRRGTMVENQFSRILAVSRRVLDAGRLAIRFRPGHGDSELVAFFDRSESAAVPGYTKGAKRDFKKATKGVFTGSGIRVPMVQ
jgi:hypothetical protein